MKKLILLSSIIASSLICFAKAEPTEKVKNAFLTSFKNATEVEWKEKGSSYEVSFSHYGTPTRIEYDAKGNILKAERQTSSALLPLSIVKKLQSAYPDLKFSAVTEVTKKKKVYYLIKIETGGELCTLKAFADGNIKTLNKCEL
jgi:hypothetical protein